MSFLQEAAIFLGAAIIAVTLFNKLGFGSVLGYLMAGAAIGPWGLGLITGVDNILNFAELGVVLLLWHEFSTLTGSPLGVLEMLVAAGTWAVGTQLLRRTRIAAPTLAISFWMMVMTALVMTALAVCLERPQWKAPSPVTWNAIWFNALIVFGIAQTLWFYLARGLPPVASTISVMFIPILGVFSGAWWLGEVLRWQDWTAVALVVVAIAAVLLPRRRF